MQRSVPSNVGQLIDSRAHQGYSVVSMLSTLSPPTD